MSCICCCRVVFAFVVSFGTHHFPSNGSSSSLQANVFIVSCWLGWWAAAPSIQITTPCARGNCRHRISKHHHIGRPYQERESGQSELRRKSNCRVHQLTASSYDMQDLISSGVVTYNPLGAYHVVWRQSNFILLLSFTPLDCTTFQEHNCPARSIRVYRRIR